MNINQIMLFVPNLGIFSLLHDSLFLYGVFMCSITAGQ